MTGLPSALALVVLFPAAPPTAGVAERCAAGDHAACCALLDDWPSANAPERPEGEPTATVPLRGPELPPLLARPGARTVIDVVTDDGNARVLIPALGVTDVARPGQPARLAVPAQAKFGSYAIYTALSCGAPTPAAAGTLEVVARADGSLAEGELLYKRNCIACHTLDGSRRVGPSFQGVYGSEVALTSGQRLRVDDAYLRESILHPNRRIVDGYPPAMPPQRLTEAQVESLLLLIKKHR